MSTTPPPTFPQNLHLAIDQGGQSTRVALYTREGRKLCLYSAPCATQHYPPEADTPYVRIEQDPQAILDGLRECLARIQAEWNQAIPHIQTAGFAGQGSSLLCWNRETGEALTPVLSWQDIRGETYLRDFPLSHDEVQALTGLRVSPHYGASKMRWCLDQIPAVKAAQQKGVLSVGPIVSYLLWHLLEERPAKQGDSFVDPGHAQRTLLWNLHECDWDPKLLGLFGITRDLLPQCKAHYDHFGHLRLGEQRIPLVACARDQGASLFARGLPAPERVYINIGTGAFIQRVSDRLQAPEGLLVSPLWVPAGSHAQRYYAWEATVNGAAAAIPFVQAHTQLAVTPQEMDQALSLNPPHPCYFLNAVGGLSAPYWRTDVQSHFSEGLSAHEKILAWIESVIFQIIVNVQRMGVLGAVSDIIISGGLSRAEAVCQKVADLTQARVYRSDDADATVQGVACMAAGLPATWHPLIQDDIFLPQSNPELQRRFLSWQTAMDTWLSLSKETV